MNRAALIAKVQRHASIYLSEIESAAKQSRIVDERGEAVDPHYPTILLICETPTHYVVELLGATSARKKLRLVQRTLSSLDDAFGRLPAASTVSLFKFSVGHTSGGLQRMTMLSERSREEFSSRYDKFSDLHPTVLTYTGELSSEDAFHPLAGIENIHDMELLDVMFVADWHGRVRARYFQSALVVSRTLSSSELQRQLVTRFPIGADTKLLAPATTRNRSLLINSANFASLAAIDRIGETTITRFLESNDEVLKIALGGVRIIAQPNLEWHEGNPDMSELAIQPDFLLVDAQGDAHLCEVKLPLLGRHSLTTGGHRRRRFVSVVADGMAQLANYQEYFSIECHKESLRERYGVNISSPRSILLVGSSENFDHEEARQAQRMLTTFELVDYDTLRALYLVGAGYLSEPK